MLLIGEQLSCLLSILTCPHTGSIRAGQQDLRAGAAFKEFPSQRKHRGSSRNQRRLTRPLLVIRFRGACLDGLSRVPSQVFCCKLTNRINFLRNRVLNTYENSRARSTNILLRYQEKDLLRFNGGWWGQGNRGDLLFLFPLGCRVSARLRLCVLCIAASRTLGYRLLSNC